MKVQFLDLQTNYQNLKDKILSGIEQNVLNKNQYVLGDSVSKFETNFAKYLGIKYCVGVANGTDALEIALQAIGVTNEDEVISQNNTFFSTCSAISRNDGKIVLVDNKEGDHMMDTDQIESKITERTRAIMPVHLYGHCADMDKIMSIAKKHNLYVIEDTAQAHGALYKGKRAGTIGDLGCFSFYPGKNLGAYGDGGAIVTNDKNLYEKLKLIRNLGSKTKYHHEIIGRNSRLDSLQAEILDIKLNHLDNWNTLRKAHARKYDELLNEIEGISFLATNDYCVPVYHLYIVRTAHRDALRAFLEECGIATGIHYPIPINKLKAYEEEDLGSFPISEKYAEEMLSLPMFPELTTEEILYTVECIKRFFENLS